MIERDEVKRLLAALLQENPAIDLDDDEIDGIVDQASILPPCKCIYFWASSIPPLVVFTFHDFKQCSGEEHPVAAHASMTGPHQTSPSDTSADL